MFRMLLSNLFDGKLLLDCFLCELDVRLKSPALHKERKDKGVHIGVVGVSTGGSRYSNAMVSTGWPVCHDIR